jgi:hypothetical protein
MSTSANQLTAEYGIKERCGPAVTMQWNAVQQEQDAVLIRKPLTGFHTALPVVTVMFLLVL